uniref:Uncharacterized protein n=1 Tax=Anguilla anguilla TaxID=7936 RepID=A0A0E9XCH7_ANGAN
MIGQPMVFKVLGKNFTKVSNS